MCACVCVCVCSKSGMTRQLNLSTGGWPAIYGDELQLQLDNKQQQEENEPNPLSECVWCELCDRSFERESDKIERGTSV